MSHPTFVSVLTLTVRRERGKARRELQPVVPDVGGQTADEGKAAVCETLTACHYMAKTVAERWAGGD